MSAPVTREIAKVLARYSRTEPIEQVEKIVLAKHPEIANASAERWAEASQHDLLNLGMETIFAANKISTTRE